MGGDFFGGGAPSQWGKTTSICWQVAECLTMHCPKCYCPLDPDPDGCVAMSCLACNEGCLSDVSAFRWSVGWFTPGTLNNQIFMVVSIGWWTKDDSKPLLREMVETHHFHTFFQVGVFSGSFSANIYSGPSELVIYLEVPQNFSMNHIKGCPTGT